MEYCEGRTLREVIDTEGISEKPEELWRLLRETLEALAYVF
jgi:translation initiation factor 2-alpha kinase 4